MREWICWVRFPTPFFSLPSHTLLSPFHTISRLPTPPPLRPKSSKPPQLSHTSPSSLQYISPRKLTAPTGQRNRQRRHFHPRPHQPGQQLRRHPPPPARSAPRRQHQPAAPATAPPAQHRRALRPPRLGLRGGVRVAPADDDAAGARAAGLRLRAAAVRRRERVRRRRGSRARAAEAVEARGRLAVRVWGGARAGRGRHVSGAARAGAVSRDWADGEDQGEWGCGGVPGVVGFVGGDGEFFSFFCRFWLESVDGLTCGCF